MKRQEKLHLKEDPFVLFMEKIFDFFKTNRRLILVGLGIVALLGVTLAGILLFQTRNVSRDNRIFAQALKIKNDEILTPDEKVTRLQKLGNSKGISAAVPFFIAQVYCEQKDWAKAEAVVRQFSGSRLESLNDAQKLLLAEIDQAMGKYKEAEDVFNKLLAVSNSTVGKDLVLLKLAKLKSSQNQKEAAKLLLQQLQADFPDSYYQSEAGTLLKSIEEN